MSMKKKLIKSLVGVSIAMFVFIIGLILNYWIFGSSIYEYEIIKLTNIKELFYRISILIISAYLICFGYYNTIEKYKTLTILLGSFLFFIGGIIPICTINDKCFIISYICTIIPIGFTAILISTIRRKVLEKKINKSINEMKGSTK